MSDTNTITKDVLAYTAQRVTLSSKKPIQETLAAVDAELNKVGAGIEIMKILATAQNKEDIEKGMEKLTEGKRDFVFFAAGSHSKWLSAYFNGTRTFTETHVYTMGNPLVAQTMLKHDLTAGLHVPPKLLVQEIEGGKGSRVIYDLPSSVICLNGNEELRKAALALDEKFENFVRKVLT
ncbi:TT1751-like protein [Panus rudis PR-1116 ss-1]|nr:TT1751-like protein [Panus rudis PR-1116 ss-1]